MDKAKVRRALFEVIRAAFFTTVFSLFALALVAVFVRAYAPEPFTVTAVNWAVKCVGIFLMCLFLVGRERALFKGMAAGVLSAIVTMLVFAAIGGGVHLDLLFLPELLVSAASGGAGALLGAKLHKEG